METQTKLNVAGLDFVPYISHKEIARRVEELGTELNRDYEGLNPLFLPILNGSFMFAADLIREICIPCQVSFVKTASYEGTQSTGKVSQLIGLEQDLEGRHIILVEDIVDTGLTIASLLRGLENFRPASVKIATLFVKPEALKEDFEIHCERHVFDVEYVVFQALDHLIHVFRITVFHLAPRSNPRTHAMEVTIVRSALFDEFDEVASLGTWANKRHFANQHIVELWQFVQSRLAQKATYRCYAVIVSRTKLWSIALGIGHHRSEFINLERLTIFTYALLGIKDFTLRCKLDG